MWVGNVQWHEAFSLAFFCGYSFFVETIIKDLCWSIGKKAKLYRFITNKWYFLWISKRLVYLTGVFQDDVVFCYKKFCWKQKPPKTSAGKVEQMCLWKCTYVAVSQQSMCSSFFWTDAESCSVNTTYWPQIPERERPYYYTSFHSNAEC